MRSEECLRVQIWVPPLELPDGRRFKVTDAGGYAMGVFPPISFLIADGAGGHIKAKFHAAESRWELVEEA